MQKNDTHDSGPFPLPCSPSTSNHDASSGGFQLKPKLREKLNKLANWRIDRSSIEFLNGVPEFRGGSATVSRALFLPPSDSQEGMSQSNPTKDEGPDLPSLGGETSWRRKDVAVKKMTMSDDRERVLGLTLREAEFLVGLSHENIINLEGFVEDLSKDVVWLVFPWGDNGTLKDFIASTEWDIPERIWLINDVAGGVEYLHSRQPPIRHGDLKSVNILVNSGCHAVITDFGSARHLKTEDLDKQTRQAGNTPQAPVSLKAESCTSTSTVTITLTGDHYTIRWAAPELLRGDEASIWSDIWALGWVAYEVMTNTIPFQHINAHCTVIARVVQGDLPCITNDARMSLIQALCSLMLACWDINAQKRPTAEIYRNLINWMPMIRPNPIRTPDASASRARSPALLMQLGDMYRRQADYVRASDSFTKALDGYRDFGDSKGKATALVRLAQVHRLRNEYSHAVTSYSEALQIRTYSGDRPGRADSLMGFALVHSLRTEYSQAIPFYSEALQIRTDIGDKPGRASALWGLAEVHQHRNEYSEAFTFYSEALQIRTDIGDRQGKAYALQGLAELHQARNEYSQAVTFYSEALQIYTDMGHKRGRADALSGLADVHRLRKEYSQAISFYSEALDIRININDRYGRAKALWGLAEVHRLRNEYSQATTLYSESLDIRTDIGDRYGRAGTLRSLAHMHRSQKEYSRAITWFSEALGICTDIGDRSGRALSLCGLGDVYHDQGNYKDAIDPYTEAAVVFEQIGDTQNVAYASSQAANARRISQREESMSSRDTFLVRRDARNLFSRCGVYARDRGSCGWCECLLAWCEMD